MMHDITWQRRRLLAESIPRKIPAIQCDGTMELWSHGQLRYHVTARLAKLLLSSLPVLPFQYRSCHPLCWCDMKLWLRLINITTTIWGLYQWLLIQNSANGTTRGTKLVKPNVFNDPITLKFGKVFHPYLHIFMRQCILRPAARCHS